MHEIVPRSGAHTPIICIYLQIPNKRAYLYPFGYAFQIALIIMDKMASKKLYVCLDICLSLDLLTVFTESIAFIFNRTK